MRPPAYHRARSCSQLCHQIWAARPDLHYAQNGQEALQTHSLSREVCRRCARPAAAATNFPRARPVARQLPSIAAMSSSDAHGPPTLWELAVQVRHFGTAPCGPPQRCHCTRTLVGSCRHDLLPHRARQRMMLLAAAARRRPPAGRRVVRPLACAAPPGGRAPGRGRQRSAAPPGRAAAPVVCATTPRLSSLGDSAGPACQHHLGPPGAPGVFRSPRRPELAGLHPPARRAPGTSGPPGAQPAAPGPGWLHRPERGRPAPPGRPHRTARAQPGTLHGAARRRRGRRPGRRLRRHAAAVVAGRIGPASRGRRHVLPPRCRAAAPRHAAAGEHGRWGRGHGVPGAPACPAPPRRLLHSGACGAARLRQARWGTRLGPVHRTSAAARPLAHSRRRCRCTPRRCAPPCSSSA